LAQEEAESRENFLAWILDFFPTARILPVEKWEELEPLLASPSPASVLLTDVLWGGEDRSTDLLLLAEKFPEVSFALFGRYDLTGSLSSEYPIPLLAPDEQLPLRLAEIMENLTGRTFGPYEISAPAGPHALGRLYWAKHQQLQRHVQILAPPAGSTVFSKTIRAWARVNHPSVYSLYESVPWENRLLVAQEPVLHRSLLHWRSAGEKPSLVGWARLASALTSVLASMEYASVPARLLGEYDFTLSPSGVARLHNPAAYPGAPEVSALANIARLADLAEPVLAGQPQADAFLRLLRHLGPSPGEAFRACRDFENQLAEVRELHVRPEEIEAAQKTIRARIRRRWMLTIGGTLLAAALVGSAFLIRYARRDLPGMLQNVSRQVPAGEVRIDGSSLTVPAFQMDSHEVTIGQYENFLRIAQALPKEELFKLLPPGSPKQSWQELIPQGWVWSPSRLSRVMLQWDLYNSARRGGRYEGTRVNRDTSVSGVDYDSAYAFARYQGRSLPSRQQFLRAGLGDGRHIYDWSGVNVGLANVEALRERKDFFGVMPGGSHPADLGPYGHADLAGNVSEWILSPPGQRPRFMGASFSETNAANLKIESTYENSGGFRDYRIGFRTVDAAGP